MTQIYIITVPTPVDENLVEFKNALETSEEIGKLLKPGNIVIYESTVYPEANRRSVHTCIRKNISSQG